MISLARLCSFDNLSSNLEVNKTGKSFINAENKAYFHQGQVGDWLNSLTAKMRREVS
jgi:hypothetical protein